MTAAPSALRDRLSVAATALSLELSTAQADRLLQYLALLQRWNSTYNLTSVRDPAQMLTLHVADCLALMKPLRRQLGGTAAVRLLDVGSGAGLPGVIIAALNPAVDVTCVDTVGKKAAFVQQAATELALPNLHSQHARVERLALPPFNVVCARAFASLADFTRLTRQHLGPGGVWLAMKGKRPDDELAQLPQDIDVFHVEPLAVPGMDAERCIVWLKPHP
jgi:16S rRNA (guanine527-N7)-methyltransferase